MEIIDKIEQELLALTVEERMEHLKEIGYFLQSVASIMKAQGNNDNPLEGNE